MANKVERKEWLAKVYQLRPGYFFSFPQPHEMQIRLKSWGESLIWLRGREGENWVSHFFSGLDGSHRLEELFQRVPKEHHENVSKILTALRPRFLIESPLGTTMDRMQKSWQQLLGVRGTAMEEYQTALAEAHVLILGAGKLGSRFATGLAQWNPQQLIIVDDEQITRNDIGESPAYAFSEVGENRGEALAKTINRMAGRTLAEGVKVFYDDLQGLRERIENSTHVFVAVDHFSPALYDKVNHITLEKKVRWSFLLVDGWDLYVGPTFFPEQSGCYHCLEQVKKSDMKEPASYEAFRESLIGGEKAPDLCSPIAADLAAGFLAADAIHLFGMMPQRIDAEAGLTIGRQLHVNLRTFDAYFHPLIKKPRCKVCGTA